jgi:hypothetical protein
MLCRWELLKLRDSMQPSSNNMAEAMLRLLLSAVHGVAMLTVITIMSEVTNDSFF